MNQYLRRKIWTLNRSGKFRGYLRTVSGYPVTLTDCMAGQPVSMAVDGNAVQDGTPSPDNPVDVVGTGVRTGNLFDISSLSGSNIEVKGTDIYLSGYACSTNTSPEKFMEMTGTQQNDMITVFLKTDVIHGFSNSALGRIGFVRKKDSNVVYLNYNKQTSVFTIPSDFSSENYSNMILYGAQLADETGQWIAVVSEPAVYKGAYTAETLPNYEPYGYKVAVTAQGRNLFDLTDVLNSNGYITSSYNKSIAITPFHIVKGQKYILITKGNQLNNDMYSSIYFGKSDLKYPTGDTKKLGTALLYYAFENNVEKRCIMTAAETCDITHIMIHGYSLYANAYNVEEFGVYEYTDDYDTMSYEPYKEPQSFNIYTPQQLAKVGDTADTVVLDFDNKTAVLTQNIISLNLKEVTGWYNSKNDLSINGFIPKDKYTTANSNKILCNFCEWSNIPDDYSIMFGSISGVGTGILLYKSFWEFNTVDELKQYISNNDIYCYYAAKNPIITDITALQDWDAMPPLWSGTAVITADTVIAPSAITAKYYASKPEEVN